MPKLIWVSGIWLLQSGRRHWTNCWKCFTLYWNNRLALFWGALVQFPEIGWIISLNQVIVISTWLDSRWHFLKASEEVHVINRNLWEIFPGRNALVDQGLLVLPISITNKGLLLGLSSLRSVSIIKWGGWRRPHFFREGKESNSHMY